MDGAGPIDGTRPTGETRPIGRVRPADEGRAGLEARPTPTGVIRHDRDQHTRILRRGYDIAAT
jgi:hypothetical protein